MRKGSVFWVALLAMVLAGALACASDDPAPAPAGPSAEEIAQMVTNAVNSAMPADTGASADDIQKMIDSAMMGMDTGASASEIRGMISDQMGDQMTAADVESVVSAAIGAMPAPQVDAAALRPLVQQAVASSVPEGVSADQIAQLVEAAVTGATAEVPTRGELSQSIEASIREQMGGQLTAEDVQKIVDASVSAAVDEAKKATAAAEAAAMAAEAAGKSAEAAGMAAEGAAMDAQKALEAMQPVEGPKDTIIFGDLNWSSALLQNRIAQYIVDKGYGYPTDVKFGATLPLFQGLRRGDTHVTMEIWLPNQDEAWNEAREEGAVLSVGQSLGKDWQSAFVIPKYLQEQYPDLDSVEDLKDDQYKALFATAETGGRARLVSCVIGWSCEDVNAKQITGYGLDDHVHVVNPGDGAALNADIYGAYERQEPWLGYQWGTNDPALKLDLVRLEEPAYSDQCWFTTKACAYEDATILIAVNPDLPGNAPDVIDMLRKWDFNIDIYKEVVRWQGDNPDADTNATALWWLNSKTDVWGGWVTDDAAAGINAALSANEIPDGWPTE